MFWKHIISRNSQKDIEDEIGDISLVQGISYCPDYNIKYVLNIR